MYESTDSVWLSGDLVRVHWALDPVLGEGAQGKEASHGQG